MQIKNPISEFEMPSAFVYMKPTLQYREHAQFVQTNHIKSSAYPNWNFKSYNFTVPLN